ncbi:MAG: AAA family ATPase, partial [Duodenibacillus sp.]|nr:AAA family ATPase [Duodenibacillus sp.]
MIAQELERNLLPAGMSGFDSLRQSGKIYVDKTLLIYRLASNKGGKYLLARPRRFGKSLLVSTFESLFKHGLRDFKGLAIEKQWDDKTYDVVRLDFSRAKQFATGQEFCLRLDSLLTQAFGNLGFAYSPDPLHTACDQLSGWLEKRPKSMLVLLI